MINGASNSTLRSGRSAFLASACLQLRLFRRSAAAVSYTLLRFSSDVPALLDLKSRTCHPVFFPSTFTKTGELTPPPFASVCVYVCMYAQLLFLALCIHERGCLLSRRRRPIAALVTTPQPRHTPGTGPCYASSLYEISNAIKLTSNTRNLDCAPPSPPSVLLSQSFCYYCYCSIWNHMCFAY